MVYENRRLAQVLGQNDGTVWWVTCFAVDSRHRRVGVGQALLQGIPSMWLVFRRPVYQGLLCMYTGTVAMFAAAGISEVSRPSPSRPVMRLNL